MLKSQEEIKDIVDERNHLELKLGEAKQEMQQYEKQIAQSKQIIQVLEFNVESYKDKYEYTSKNLDELQLVHQNTSAKYAVAEDQIGRNVSEARELKR